MDFFKNLFGKKNSQERYETEKKIALSDSQSDRLKLAQNKNTHQEILFYLAQNDKDAKVRAAVAVNKSTPVQASQVLCADQNVDVRLALAGRLALLLPELSQDKHSQLYKFAVEALGTLALDEVLKIRVALSSALKDCTDTPPKIAGQLARDLEREVSEPILRFCIALSDEDLLDILKGHPASWAVQAIASRPKITAPVSQAVIDTDDVAAGTILITNSGAEISLETLKDIVEKAKSYPEWQKPVALHKKLPADLGKELAGFVDQSVRNILMERTDFDHETMDELSKIVQRRIDFMDDRKKDQSLSDYILALSKTGQLNDERMADAISVRDRDFVVTSLAVLLRVPVDTVERVFAMGAAKPVVALCWKSGISMRNCLKIQQEIVKIPHTELVYPKGGTDYPLTEEDIVWQLNFIGISK